MRSRVCPTPPRSCKCWRRVTEQTPAADCGYEEAPARVLAVTQNITLDGSIELLGDWFDPQGQGGVDNSDLLEELHRQDGEADALLLGRQTFEDFRGYWPLQTEDPTGITDYLNSVQKYVVTSTLTEPGWQNTTTLTGDPVEAVRSLKNRPGKDIVLTGSITLCHALIEAGLVDEYRLFVYPTVQGRGRRLFPDGYALDALRLLEANSLEAAIRTMSTARATSMPFSMAGVTGQSWG